jgi:hypothetical protein
MDLMKHTEGKADDGGELVSIQRDFDSIVDARFSRSKIAFQDGFTFGLVDTRSLFVWFTSFDQVSVTNGWVTLSIKSSTTARNTPAASLYQQASHPSKDLMRSTPRWLVVAARAAAKRAKRKTVCIVSPRRIQNLRSELSRKQINFTLAIDLLIHTPSEMLFCLSERLS